MIKPPKGVKQVTKLLASGSRKIYWYHRGTKSPIKAEPGTADAYVEVQRKDRLVNKAVQRSELASARSMSALIKAYKQSSEFQGLAPRTKSDYQRVFDWIGSAADKVAVAEISRTDIKRLQQRAFAAHKRRFANSVLQVVRL